MKNNFQYMLRYTIAPDCCEDERISALIDFCKAAEVDDLMFFVNCEEINTGHITEGEQERWLELAEKVRKETDKIGVTFSLNPWNVLLHCDRGRTLKPGQNFRRMVGMNGEECAAVGCPTDPSFIEYIKGVYSRYAQIHPDTLWIEDDMRLHNHAPLKWGGCFCEGCMKFYSEIAGRSLTREELVKEAFAEGAPRPLRKVWLEGARKIIVNLCTELADAVFSVDRNIRLGLMTSQPADHCLEWREWNAIKKVLTGNKAPYFRPHLPSYSEVTSKGYMQSFDRIPVLTAAFLEEETQFAPELENFPYTRYAKSVAYTAFQIETTCIFKSCGITLNIFDMMGSGVFNGKAYQNMLKRIKPFLNFAYGVVPGVHHMKGVRVLVSPNACQYTYADGRLTPAAMLPMESEGAAYLGTLSVSWKYETEPIAEDGVTFAAGQCLRGFSRDKLCALLKRGKWIFDGEAILSILDMGLGDVIGISKAECATDEICSYEETVAGDRYYGVERVRMTAQIDAGTVLKLTSCNDAPKRVYSMVYNPFGKPLFDTVSVYRDRFFVLPYIGCPQSYGTHCHPVLAELIHAFIDGRASYISDAPLLRLYEYEKDGKRTIVLTNPSTDDYQDVEITIANVRDFEKATIVSSRLGEINQEEAIVLKSEQKLIYAPTIEHFETIIIAM